MVTQTINLNMVPGSVYPVVHVNQFDNDAGALIFKLYNGEAFSIPSSSAVVINGTKPDGYGFTYSASYSGNTVTADVTEQMTAVAGEVKCELRITKGTDVVGTQNFTLMVEPAALDSGTVVSDSDIPAIAAASTYASEAASAAAIVQAASSLTNGAPTVINSGSIDDIVTPGYYLLPNSGSSSTVADLPEGINGNLWVYQTFPSNTTPLRQIFMRIGTTGSNDRNIYVRQKNTNGEWGRWWKYGDSTQFVPAGNSFSVSLIYCIGSITSTQKNLAFFVPYSCFDGTTFTVNNFGVIVRYPDMANGTGIYPYVRSGSSGNTYTQLGYQTVYLVQNGSNVRSNEISNIAYTVVPGAGIYIVVSFVYAIVKANGDTTAVENNLPVSVQVSLSGTIS